MASEEVLERRVGELEDELSRKRDAVAEFIFKWLTDNYGTSTLTHEKKRKAVLSAFSDLYANWDRL